MPQLKSKIAADIRKDQGAPQKLSPDEQCAGTDMDDRDRGDWPEGEDVSSDFTPANSKRKSGQFGTT